MYGCVHLSEYDNVWNVHSIEFKFIMYGIGHRWAKVIVVDKFKMHRFFLKITKRFSTAFGIELQKIV